MKTLLSSLLLLLLTTKMVSAINAVRYYRLGDTDAATAVHGAAVTTTLDNWSVNHLTASGALTYSSDAAAFPLHDSRLALNFTGTQYASGALVALTDNFGIELWVKPRVTSGNRCLAYNGNSGSNGWGLYQTGSTFAALFGGVAFFGSAPVVVNEWTHLALVRASGTATLYVNGVAAGTTAGAPITPAGLFALGAAPTAFTHEFFDGLLDEVRVFALGAFEVSDLRYSKAEVPPLLFTSDGGTSVLRWPSTDAVFRPQFSMDLGVSSWNDLPETFNTDRRFETTDTTTDSRRFYRLFRQNDLLARIQPQGVERTDSSPFRNLVIAEQDPDYRVFRTVLIRNHVSHILDFSQTTNARISSRSGLLYRWSVEYEDAAFPNPYFHPGIQGHDSPVLRIAPNSLPNTGAQGLTFRLYIDDPDDPVPYRGVACSIDASVRD